MIVSPNLAASRKLLAVVFTLLGLVLSGLQPQATSAAIKSCRRDPIVTLSNGYSANITATLATDASNVKNIVYTVRAPHGVALSKVTYVGSSNIPEQVLFYADQPAGSYNVDMVATTGTPNVAVTATVKIGSQSRSIAGVSGAHLIMQFNNVP